MHDELFGELTRDKDGGCWNGRVKLASFAGCGAVLAEGTLRIGAVQSDDADDDPEFSRQMEQFDALLDRASEELIGVGYQDELEEDDDSTDADLSSDEDRNIAARQQGIVDLSIHDEAGSGPSDAQRAAFSYLLENASPIHARVIDGILFYYQRVVEDYRETFADIGDIDKLVPHISSADQLRPLILLEGVDVHRRGRDEIPCIGFTFWCTWEDEHGLGVLTRRGEVVEVGYAESAFDEPE